MTGYKLFLLSATIVLLCNCNPISRPSKTRWVVYDFMQQTDYHMLVRHDVKLLRYKAVSDNFDTLTKTAAQSVSLLKSMMLDTTLSHGIDQRESGGYLEVRGNENGVKVVFVFEEVTDGWILVEIQDFST